MVLKNKNSKKHLGQFFTPNYIAKFMVKNVYNFLNRSVKINIEKITVLEPSVGKGIFLNHLLKHGFKNITAYEIDKSLEEYLTNKYPYINLKFKNILKAPIEEKYDIIIGNPPYLGQNYNAQIFQEYVKKYPICKKYFVGNMDLFYYFIHIGIEKLKPGGILSFITTNYWVTKSRKTGIKLLKPHILNECYLIQYIDLSNMILFNKAKGQHNCIFMIQKKKNKEKNQEINQKIDVIQIKKLNNQKIKDRDTIKLIFKNLINNKEHNLIRKYSSALTNHILKRDNNWNLLYPKEVKIIVDQFEELCNYEDKLLLLKDYFIIRNGIIFIKDNLFILREKKNLIFKNSDIFIKINGELKKLTDIERNRLKKIYKSKSIKKYGHSTDEFVGYGIYLSKNEFQNKDKKIRNQLLREKYPNLSKFIFFHSKELRGILLNAKEDQDDLYFPRRGAFILKENNGIKNLVSLEESYECGKKIFFKYISDNNTFGYSDTQYFATSDTYFLWPKRSEDDIDYLFLLAYLNSRIIYFLFRAKNIKIKRSKTKLEYNLPIPFMDYFRSEGDLILISLIRILTSHMIKLSINNNSNFNLDMFDEEFYNLGCFSYLNISERIKLIKIALNKKDSRLIQEIIDDLFFKLFKIDREKIDSLIEKYYD